MQICIEGNSWQKTAFFFFFFCLSFVYERECTFVFIFVASTIHRQLRKSILDMNFCYVMMHQLISLKRSGIGQNNKSEVANSNIKYLFCCYGKWVSGSSGEEYFAFLPAPSFSELSWANLFNFSGNWRVQYIVNMNIFAVFFFRFHCTKKSFSYGMPRNGKKKPPFKSASTRKKTNNALSLRINNKKYFLV